MSPTKKQSKKVLKKKVDLPKEEVIKDDVILPVLPVDEKEVDVVDPVVNPGIIEEVSEEDEEVGDEDLDFAETWEE